MSKDSWANIKFDAQNYIALVLLEEGLGVKCPTEAQIHFFEIFLSGVMCRKKQILMKTKIDRFLSGLLRENRYNNNCE